MSVNEQVLAEENQRLRHAIEKHRAQKADDRCIEDDDELYAALGDGIKCDRRVGDKAAMLENCKRFIENRCESGHWMSYAELEQQNEKAKKAIAHLLKRIKDDEATCHQIGFGTQSFHLLTEAAAALFNEPLDKVVDHYIS